MHDEPTIPLDTRTLSKSFPSPTPTGSCERMVAMEGVRAVLRLLGDDPHRDGLTDTPRRVIDALIASCDRTGMDSPDRLMTRVFDTTTRPDQMIAVGPIAFASLCEHHLLPFAGNAWIAYLPTAAKVVGLSKFGRLVDWHARGLQVQERLTAEIVDSITTHAGVDSAACLIRSEHSCMTTRGVAKTGTSMVTSDLRGAFRANPETRTEFLAFTRN